MLAGLSSLGVIGPWFPFTAKKFGCKLDFPGSSDKTIQGHFLDRSLINLILTTLRCMRLMERSGYGLSFPI